MDRLEKFAEIFDEYFARTQIGYERFAAILTVLARKEGRPWQKTFIYNLLNGAKGYKIGDLMWSALLAFEKEKTLAIRLHVISSIYEIPMGALAPGKPRKCAWSKCGEWLVPDHPNRMYCPYDRCRAEARNERKRNKV